MKLAVVIINYNSSEDLGKCLVSLETCAPSYEHTVVVVDNASRDGSPQLVYCVSVVDADVGPSTMLATEGVAATVGEHSGSPNFCGVRPLLLPRRKKRAVGRRTA